MLYLLESSRPFLKLDLKRRLVRVLLVELLLKFSVLLPLLHRLLQLALVGQHVDAPVGFKQVEEVVLKTSSSRSY